MKVYYYHDKVAHECLNKQGKDYTASYIPVILKNLGYTSLEICEREIEEFRFAKGDVLFIGADVLSDKAADNLEKATANGLTVIAFGSTAKGILPDVASVQNLGGQYDTVAYFSYGDSEELLPVLTSYAVLQDGAYEVLGTLKNKKDITSVAYVKPNENVYLFTFDLPGTLLYIADGKPTYEGKPPFEIGRISEAIILEEGYNDKIACADSYLREVERILSSCGHPRMYPLPPQAGKACDLVVYFGGDDDAVSVGSSRAASQEMLNRGLPYHLNIMPKGTEGAFEIPKELFDLMKRRGQETAIHFDFLTFPYTTEGHKIQCDLYAKQFGERPIGSVNHCVIQGGTAAERYRMQLEAGIITDNNRFSARKDPDDPNVNALNLVGFAFGTAFPRFVIDDAEHGNRPLDFCETYNCYYEPRIYEDKPEEYEKMASYLSDGVYYGRPLELFYHPHHISNVWCDGTPAFKALDYAISYIKEKGWNVRYTAPDALALWWFDRARCKIDNVSDSGFQLVCPEKDRKYTIALPDGVKDVAASDADALVEKKNIAGKMLTLLTVSGSCNVSYRRA